MAVLLGEHKAASLTQVRAGKGGRLVEVDADVFDVAKRLHQIDRSLGVDWNDTAGYFRITQLLQDGRKHVVMTTLELTPDVIQRVAATMHPDYDLAGELARIDARTNAERDRQFSEKTGEIGERLHQALRKDLGMKPRAFIPAGVRSVEPT